MDTLDGRKSQVQPVEKFGTDNYLFTFVSDGHAKIKKSETFEFYAKKINIHSKY